MAWYAQFPLTAFTTQSVPAQIEALQALQIPGQLLPDALRVVESPLQPLQQAEERRRELEGLLLLIALPVAGALLYFVVMAVRLGAEDQASPMSTLRLMMRGVDPALGEAVVPGRRDLSTPEARRGA